MCTSSVGSGKHCFLVPSFPSGSYNFPISFSDPYGEDSDEDILRLNVSKSLFMPIVQLKGSVLRRNFCKREFLY